MSARMDAAAEHGAGDHLSDFGDHLHDIDDGHFPGFVGGDEPSIIPREVAAAGREYLILRDRADPMYNDVVRAQAIVREFIISRGLVLYGGTSIDFALRLVGTQLYPDDDLPDFDFYSPRSVEDAYDLAEIFYKSGFENARTLAGIHKETMRVDIGDNHFVADISYCPPEILPMIPTLSRDGMKFVHPQYQYLDVHSALSFPYDDAPQEVIFARWRKDIKRFNLLAEYYPPGADPTLASKSAVPHPAASVGGSSDITKPGARTLIPTVKTRAPAAAKKFPLGGFAAYALYYSQAKSAGIAAGAIPAEIEFASDGSMLFSGMGQITVASHSRGRAVAAFGGDGGEVTEYEPMFNLVPHRLEFKEATVHLLENRILAVGSGFTVAPRVRAVGPQFLLKYFLGMSFVSADKPALAETYRAYYRSMLGMMNAAVGKEGCTMFLPGISTYGSENINTSREVALQFMYAAIGKLPQPVIPRSYNVGMNIENGKPRPVIDMEKIEFFKEAGRKITAKPGAAPADKSAESAVG